MARLSPGTMTAAIFAILIGLAGAYVVRQYLHQASLMANTPVVAPASTSRTPGKIYVPVAADDLKVGHKLTLNDIVVRSFTSEEFKKSKYSRQAYMQDTEQIQDRVLKAAIAKDAVFDPTQFFGDGEAPGIAEMLPPGYRAVTVPIENVGAVQGFARPGSKVDVMFRSRKDGDRPEITLTLLEMVEVLAVDKIIQPGQDINLGGSGRQGTVTLAVAPLQAKALKAVEGRGELSLALRSPDDLTIDQDLVQAAITDVSDIRVSDAERRLTVDDLLGLPSIAETKAKTMDIYRAGSKQTVEFEAEEVVEVETSPVPGFMTTPIAAEPAQRGNLQTSRSRVLEPIAGGG